MADRVTGKAGGFLYAGVLIPFTKMTPKLTRKLADSTDSGDYVQTPDMIFPTCIPTSVLTEISVEGRYRFSSTPSSFVTVCYTSATLITAVIQISPNGTWGTGPVDVSDFQTEIPVDDIVVFTCNIRSNGQWTPL